GPPPAPRVVGGVEHVGVLEPEAWVAGGDGALAPGDGLGVDVEAVVTAGGEVGGQPEGERAAPAAGGQHAVVELEAAREQLPRGRGGEGEEAGAAEGAAVTPAEVQGRGVPRFRQDERLDAAGQAAEKAADPSHGPSSLRRAAQPYFGTQRI